MNVARLENSVGVRLKDETAISFLRPESGNWRFATQPIEQQTRG
jgi:hypothetical protein